MTEIMVVCEPIFTLPSPEDNPTDWDTSPYGRIFCGRWADKDSDGVAVHPFDDGGWRDLATRPIRGTSDNHLESNPRGSAEYMDNSTDSGAMSEDCHACVVEKAYRSIKRSLSSLESASRSLSAKGLRAVWRSKTCSSGACQDRDWWCTYHGYYMNSTDPSRLAHKDMSDLCHEARLANVRER